MFFWNKYCGLALLFLSLNTSLSAQNLDSYPLIEQSFLLKSTSLIHVSNDDIFLENGWLFKQRDNSIPGKLLSSIPFISPADDTRTAKNTGLSFNLTLDNLIAFNPLQFDSDKRQTKILPSDFSTCQYGFFCKQEMKIEKATSLPLRVRLGSLQQCNYYEGKP